MTHPGRQQLRQIVERDEARRRAVAAHDREPSHAARTHRTGRFRQVAIPGHGDERVEHHAAGHAGVGVRARSDDPDHDVAAGDDADRPATLPVVDGRECPGAPIAQPAGDHGKRSRGRAGHHRSIAIDRRRAAIGAALACATALVVAIRAPETAAAKPAAAASAPAPGAAADVARPTPAPTAAPAPATTAVDGRVVRVHDGDSLLLRIEGQGVRGVRIAGIDAPEKGQPFADVARRALLAQLDDREIRVEVVKTDFFDRLVGRVFVDGRDAGLAQLRAGLAWHFARYDADLAPAQRRRYAQAERQARLRGLGLWRDATPIPPWEYRAQARRSHARDP